MRFGDLLFFCECSQRDTELWQGRKESNRNEIGNVVFAAIVQEEVECEEVATRYEAAKATVYVGCAFEAREEQDPEVASFVEGCAKVLEVHPHEDVTEQKQMSSTLQT